MINFDNYLCSGCKACEQICPTNAMNMFVNSEGFMYPKINEKLCVNCGLCDKVCPYKNKKLNNEFQTMAYACINKNDEIRKNSSSGGMFYEIARYVIENKGVVFGCEMNVEMKAVHSFSEVLEDCRKYLGSKYVQSDIGNAYKQAQEFLENKRKVLFSGTPCQIDGLKLFLRKEYDNLMTCDVVCHGVPSPKILDKYLREITNKANSKVISINFRDKREGWKGFVVVVVVESGEEFCADLTRDAFLRLFLSNIDLRPSCHNCASNGLNRRADITLADFWGVENKYPEMFDNKGTSLVLINNAKGQKIFEDITNNLITMQVDLDYAIQCNPCIVSSVKPHVKRKDFFNNLEYKSCEQLVNKYTKEKILHKSINKCKMTIKKILKKIIYR